MTTYQFISGTVYFLAPLDRAVVFAVGYDLLVYGFGVIPPRSRLNHALQDAGSQLISFGNVITAAHNYSVKINLN